MEVLLSITMIAAGVSGSLSYIALRESSRIAKLAAQSVKDAEALVSAISEAHNKNAKALAAMAAEISDLKQRAAFNEGNSRSSPVSRSIGR